MNKKVENMTITIRPATTKDYIGIEALLNAEFTTEIARILTQDLQERLRTNTQRSFVAVDKSNIIGHASIKGLDTPRISFGELVVAASYRNQSIASALTAARLGYLERIRYQGIATSDAVTNHSYSQQSLIRAGFSPVRILLGRLPECSDRLETTVGFVRLFRLPLRTTSLYVPEAYRDIASTVLSPFARFAHKDSSSQDISRLISEISKEDLQKPNYLIAVRLYEHTAPAEIAYLAERGFIIAGFYLIPIQENTLLSAVAYMHRVPTELLDKTRIHIARPVQPLFDFVWKLYETQRKDQNYEVMKSVRM